MNTKLSNRLNAGFGATAILVAITGVAWGSGLDSDPLWRCHANCDNVQRTCHPDLKACCCGGHELGPFGTCGCASACNAIDPPCYEGTLVILP
jgi:hypothetical protein